ncbi:30S ribosomal protein S19 [bacterium]|nr:30S ribosomal protein S19 [bacterium]
MSRSLKKGPYIDAKLLKKIEKGSKNTPIKTWSRASEISPEMVGFTFLVHNGKDFLEVNVGEDMIGHRLGEFAITRKFVRHGGRIQKELEQQEREGGAPQTAPGQPTPERNAK